ncbi:hypothetical protein E2C01_077991 [Portunus trituberculatus]|uniref:Uncharacterized protein n=1 Tax=Portunus trituberculatus TaxID=210409 RepID=A0A5B7ISX7_PORTR|nr:hypothetical protein [Portunus trituberculatus]
MTHGKGSQLLKQRSNGVEETDSNEYESEERTVKKG